MPPAPPVRRIHPIELESYRILRSRVDTSQLPPLTRAVVERVVHTTADVSWLGDIVADETALGVGRAALLAGAPLVVDVRMVAAGVTGTQSVVALDLVTGAEGATTRSAAGIRAAAQRYPDGAVWAIGNAPTALAALVDLTAAGLVRPAFVVGLPVGFVGSVAAKAALRATGLPSVSCATERGGAAVAAAAVNALRYAEDDTDA